ncbi:N-acyl amino acid synthase FeeM domain-containing protein [Wenxinia saemankumensis]|uniref:N-acyl amino acid synthase FeeM catalytic core domain-containing protein n=1 Tax=Wenxinia saemankumensis TaxID=1447782 RepID=A0A1M6ADL4_9RHOB|nr:GNAT family N-acetyltransferase [Wenxinia saemankumensis]SHI34497.1 hypothetical protein SAMN05444417_0374 [Wenxinia saemankumensis]
MNEQVLAALKRARYRVVTGGTELEEIHRLRYKCYLAERSISANEHGLMADAFDELENCVNVAIDVDGKLLAAVRLHLVTKRAPVSPTLRVFPEVAEGLDRGLTILDPTRFVVDPSARQQKLPLHFLGVRVPLLGTMFYDTDLCLIPVRPEHAPFYRRYLNSELAIGPRDYLGLKKKLQLMVTDVRVERDAILQRAPVFGPIPGLPEADVPFPSLSRLRVVAARPNESDAA